MYVQQVPLPGLPSWILTPAPPLLCVAEGPPWATDLPLLVEMKWLQSDREAWVREASKPAIPFFFWNSKSKNIVTVAKITWTKNFIYYGRDDRKFKQHMKNWWDGILLCSEIASAFVILIEITFLAGMLAAQLRPQLILFSCVTVCCDVTMQKPAQLLVTVKMSCRILENICAFLHSSFWNGCAALALSVTQMPFCSQPGSVVNV